MSEVEEKPIQKPPHDEDEKKDWGHYDRDYGRVRTGEDAPPEPPEGGGP